MTAHTTIRDIVEMKEEGAGIEDGVVGASFLSNFDVEIRFGAMTVSLEKAIDRMRREEGRGEPPESLPLPPKRAGG